MKTLFEKGDKVIVRPDAATIRGAHAWNNEMAEYINKEYVVRTVYDDGCTLETCNKPSSGINRWYESGYWLFSFEWLIPCDNVKFEENEIESLFMR